LTPAPDPRPIAIETPVAVASAFEDVAVTVRLDAVRSLFSPTNARVAPPTVLSASRTESVMPPAFVETKVVVADSLDVDAIVTAPAMVSVVGEPDVGVTPAAAPVKASVVPEADAVALPPTPEKRPTPNGAVVDDAVSVAPALRSSEPPVTVVFSPT
jgi:hypothetical protein